MIYGIGVDMVLVERMHAGLRRFGDRLPRRILSKREYRRYLDSRRPAQFLAQRFAAKEATAKALGTGFSEGVFARDIAVDNDARGKPVLEFSGNTGALIAQLGIAGHHISLSDEGDYAIAFVTLEQGAPSAADS